MNTAVVETFVKSGKKVQQIVQVLETLRELFA